MRLLAFVGGSLAGMFFTFYLFFRYVDIELAVNTTQILDMCEKYIPRNQYCVIVAVPQNRMNGGIPNVPPLGNPTQGGFPLLQPPPLQENEPSFR